MLLGGVRGCDIEIDDAVVGGGGVSAPVSVLHPD